MPHAKTLRAIGQSLEALGVVAFILKKAGQSYLVHAEELPKLLLAKEGESLSATVGTPGGGGRGEARLKDGALAYDPRVVSRLDVHGQKRRRRRDSAQVTAKKALSQLMRVVGTRLDRVEPHTFILAWTPAGVSIEYQLSDGQRVKEELNPAKLGELVLEMRQRREARHQG